MDREIELNLILFRVKIKLPSVKTAKEEEPKTLSRSASASDWEFFKMNYNSDTRRPFTLTKSYAALNFICELENNVAQEESEEDDDYCLPHSDEVSAGRI